MRSLSELAERAQKDRGGAMPISVVDNEKFPWVDVRVGVVTRWVLESEHSPGAADVRRDSAIPRRADDRNPLGGAARVRIVKVTWGIAQ